MSDAESQASDDASAQPFLSLKELRDAHSHLLKQLRDSGEVTKFLPNVETFVQRGRATGARLDAEQDRWDAQRSLDYWTTMLYRAGLEPPDATLAEFDPGKAPRLPDELCPYLGLDAFQEENRENFFGRRQLIEQMIARLAERRLLAVVGPSGSGKSSVVRAGVIPALKQGALPGSEHWHYFLKPIVPGSDPLANLARALYDADNPSAEWLAEQARLFRERPDHLLRQLDALGAEPSVLVIDQFEELFTLCDDEQARRALADNLLQVLCAPDARHVIILTMRIDFEPFVARLPEFYTLFSAAEERMTPLSAAELREAIERPAGRVGLEFEAGVVDSLLQDILGEPAALPLLQFTLLKLWENRLYNRVTMDAYNRLGGGRLALARSADALYDSLSPQYQKTMQRILLRMVRPGTGLEVLRSRVRVASLYLASEAPEWVNDVLQRLIKARLVRLTPGERPEDAQVEVAHEALVRNWPLLVEWLEEERAALVTRRRLEAKALEWVRLGSGTSGLLDAAQLFEAQRWLESPEAVRLGYDPALPSLVEASRAALERAEQQKAEARLREMEQARALEDAERKRVEEEERAKGERKTAKRLRRFARTLALLVLLGITLALLASWLGWQARQQATLAAQEQRKAIKAQGVAEEQAKKAHVAEEQAKIAAGDALKAQTKAEEQARKAAENEAIALKEKRNAQEALRKYQKEHQGRQEEHKGRIIAEKEIAVLLGAKTGGTSGSSNSNNAVSEPALNSAGSNLRMAVRPITPGASFSSGTEKNYLTASSACCVVRDSAGNMYLLLLNSDNYKVGEPIIQPGSLDGGKPKDVVATVTQVGGEYPFGALALLKEGVEATNEIRGVGRIQDLATAEINQVVMHIGRSSGLVRGIVTSTMTDVIVATEDGDVKLKDMILVRGLNNSPFSSGGDGGGPVFTQDRKLIGVIVAGSATHTIIMPIRRFMQGLKVELAP